MFVGRQLPTGVRRETMHLGVHRYKFPNIPDSNKARILELLNIVASCTDPCHRATMSVISKFTLQITCTFIEKYPFLFL